MKENVPVNYGIIKVCPEKCSFPHQGLRTSLPSLQYYNYICRYKVKYKVFRGLKEIGEDEKHFYLDNLVCDTRKTGII